MIWVLQNTDAMDDSILLKELTEGNIGAMRELMDRYIPLVSRTSYRILCDRVDSETVTHEVFMKLWKHPRYFVSKHGLETRLLRLTCRMSRYRLVRRRFLAYFSINPDIFVASAPAVPSADEYIVRQAWEIYCRASRNCSDLERIAYTLCELEGVPVDKASEVMNPWISSVGELLENARSAVMAELDHYGRTEDYPAYLRFLRKVEDQLTDKIKAQRMVLADIKVGNNHR